MMKIFEIEKLIADFYEGKTSVEQEKELKLFFETQDVPPHLMAEKRVFLEMFFDDNEIEIPPHLEQKLSNQIDSWAEKENRTKLHQSRRIKSWYFISGIAASVCLILGIALYRPDKQEKTVLTDTYTNPQDAYRETQKALLLVSNNLNKGMNQMEHAEKDVKKVNAIINKQLYQ
ncbi:hypothetical protein [Bacteroides sedimenti]|uniref:Anti-sigma factor n=1 Tax=Bacteroides sedimenti TaxID=2136147 RepID=A0ABN6Z3G5_9BACE